MVVKLYFHSLLVTRCKIACHSSEIHSSLVSRCLLFVSRCLLFVSRCLLFVSLCLLFVSRYLSFVSRCMLFVSRCLLFASRCLLFTYCWILVKNSLFANSIVAIYQLQKSLLGKNHSLLAGKYQLLPVMKLTRSKYCLFKVNKNT